MGKPVFGIDIDGTLGDYHSHFLKCAEMFLQRDMPDPTEINPLLPLHRHMGVAKLKYREIKMAYRQGRWKRSMPVFEGARELTVELRRAGAEIIICTTRPFNQLGEVDADTRWWLRHHGIQHDFLIWGEHKYRDLRKMYGIENVVAVLDDELEQMNRCHDLRLPFYLRDQPYNQTRDMTAPTAGMRGASVRVNNLYDAKNRMMQDLEYWRGRTKRTANRG